MEIWQIIPNITSPLAVLSFLFYIFYLFKQSSDRKKEKSLSVSDPIAQQSAVKLVLSDYPDIKIDPISDPPAALELAKKIISDRLERYHKTLTFSLRLAVLFAFTYLISLLLQGDPVKFNEKEKATSTWAQSKAQGKLPYLLLSVVCHITLRDEILPDSSSVRKAYFRYHYTLKALEDIVLDSSVFLEQFTSTDQTNIRAWAGSAFQQIESVNTGAYWVRFNAKKNEILTLTTGANFEYSFPLNKNAGSAGCFTEMKLGENEWLTCYNNSTDYIDKIIIIVEGDNVKIELPPQAAHRKGTRPGIDEGRCMVYPPNSNKCTLVAKWEQLSPGDYVGLKIRWSLPS